MRAMKQVIPTPASIRKAYVEEYLKRPMQRSSPDSPNRNWLTSYESMSHQTLKASIHSSTITTMTEYAMTWQ